MFVKNLILNKRWLFYVAVFTFLTVFAAFTLDESFGISLAMMIVGAVFLLGYVFAVPNACRIDENGIKVYYAFGVFCMTVAWKDLKCIEDQHSRFGVLPWLREYHIGYFTTRFRLWEETCIPKNGKTTNLLARYCKNEIEKI